MIALLLMTDGRDETLMQTAISSYKLFGDITEWWIHDDSGQGFERFSKFPGWKVIGHPEGRQGFGGAIRYAWSQLREQSDAKWIFHLEDDFLFNRNVNLNAMIEVLEANPYLAQMALRRQAWNAAEKAAGGVIEMNPEAFLQAHTRLTDDTLQPWICHSQFFTTNPCLYSRDLIETRDWPTGDFSEGKFTHQLLSDGRMFGYWGEKTDTPWVEHVGHTRNGVGY